MRSDEALRLNERRPMMLVHCMAHELFFFFQAEDGIRDLTVTGVQTCALPIYRIYAMCGNGPNGFDLFAAHGVDAIVEIHGRIAVRNEEFDAVADARQLRARFEQIGRASCRERG